MMLRVCCRAKAMATSAPEAAPSPKSLAVKTLGTIATRTSDPTTPTARLATTVVTASDLRAT